MNEMIIRICEHFLKSIMNLSGNYFNCFYYGLDTLCKISRNRLFATDGKCINCCALVNSLIVETSGKQNYLNYLSLS